MNSTFKMIALAFVAVAAMTLMQTDAQSAWPNRTLIVTSILSAPYLFQRTENEPLRGNERYQGYCADLIGKLAEILDFKYEIKIVADGKYGMRNENGTWNGMIGELTRREVDLAVAPLTVTSMRERVVDFSTPYMNLGISIMIKKPKMTEVRSGFFFLNPFTGTVWLCLLGACAVIGLLMFAIGRFVPAEKRQVKPAAAESNDDVTTSSDRFSVSNSLWYSLRTMLQQGTNTDPRSISGRILSAIWWLFVIVIIAVYTANLVAAIVLDKSEIMLTPIESVDDLAKQSEIKYGTLEAGTTKTFFQSSKIPVYEKMWSVMTSSEPSVFAQTTEEGVNRVRESKGTYAFLLESTMNDYYNQRKPCDTMKVGSELDSKSYGIAMQINSPLRAKINLAILQLIENESLEKLRKKWWYDKGECPSSTFTGGETEIRYRFRALTLSSISGVLYMLIAGAFLAIVVAVVEFVIATIKNKGRNDNKSDVQMDRKGNV